MNESSEEPPFAPFRGRQVRLATPLELEKAAELREKLARPGGNFLAGELAAGRNPFAPSYHAMMLSSSSGRESPARRECICYRIGVCQYCILRRGATDDVGTQSNEVGET